MSLNRLRVAMPRVRLFLREVTLRDPTAENDRFRPAPRKPEPPNPDPRRFQLPPLRFQLGFPL